MKRTLLVSMIMCALAAACAQRPDDREFIRIRTGQKLYIEKMKTSRPDFFQLNTLVTIENGMVTGIDRRWIP